MRRAKVDFLWFKKGEFISDDSLYLYPNWNEYVEEVEDKKEQELKPKLKERIKDFTEDILDDGKRNYSNRRKGKKRK